jgi:hypothetical protein
MESAGPECGIEAGISLVGDRGAPEKAAGRVFTRGANSCLVGQ